MEEDNEEESEDDDERMLQHYAPVDDYQTTGGIGVRQEHRPVFATDLDALFMESLGVDWDTIWDEIDFLGTGFQYRYQYTFCISRSEADTWEIAPVRGMSVFAIDRAIAPEDIVLVRPISGRP